MHPVSKLIVESTRDVQLDERKQKIFHLAYNNSYDKLLKYLDAAIDRRDLERVNLLLDATQAAHHAGRLAASLSPQILQEIRHARNVQREGNPKRNDGNN